MHSGIIKIGLIQTEVTENPDANLDRTVVRVKEAIDAGANIICLQELFRAPYFPQHECTDSDRYADTIPGKTTRIFSDLAKDNHVVLIIPLYERDGSGHYYNSAVVIDAGGNILPPYRKVHIPYDPLYYEKNYFRPGSGYQVYDTRYGRIAVLICYDQWFPEAARVVTLKGARMIFYPTAIGWIKGMEEPCEGDWQDAWETVQRGHAIANGVHVAAVNRVGIEGDLQFWGGSFIADSFGNVVARAGSCEEVLVAEIDLGMNEKVREGWGFLKNRRPETYNILTTPVSAIEAIKPAELLVQTPLSQGYHMPAEWENHEGIWLAWPHDNLTFPQLGDVEITYCEIIRSICRTEQVHLVVCDEEMKAHVISSLERERVDPGLVHFLVHEYADVWFRDYGPIFIVNKETGSLAMVNWRFNAWGGKYPELIADDAIPFIINSYLKIPVFTPGIVMEGGSIDVNGKGTLLTTEQCLLNPNRNPGLSREDIEYYLQEFLGIRNVIWLKKGIAGDDTDGHIDDIARFTGENTVLCAIEEDSTDKNYDALQENYRILKGSCDQDGNPLSVIPVPMPGIVADDQRFPASYMNFYIGNEIVLVPIFGHRNDRIALLRIEEAFPGRKIIGIDCSSLVEGMGAIHCISQQQPRP
ncbi:MAG TPA: agmatine deiminase family protein [Methanoregulaceae archaeon]|nr:agmatine deiminase family protein [Methanoregulaceae archaeon]